MKASPSWELGALGCDQLLSMAGAGKPAVFGRSGAPRSGTSRAGGQEVKGRSKHECDFPSVAPAAMKALTHGPTRCR